MAKSPQDKARPKTKNRPPFPTYSPEEVSALLSSFKEGISLAQLSTSLGRPAYGVAVKLRSLSESDPEIWTPSKVADLTRSEIKAHKGDLVGQKRRWHARRRGNRKAGNRRTRGGSQTDVETRYRQFWKLLTGKWTARERRAESKQDTIISRQ